MQKTSSEALELSIEKWKRNTLVQNPDDAEIKGDSCPLCAIFNQPEMLDEEKCFGCPVFENTQLQDCEDTPWQQTRRTLKVWRTNPLNTNRRDAFHRAAQIEVEFLESLRTPT